MDTYGKILFLTLWCFACLLRSANAQGYLYKNKDVTRYEIRNGKYRIVPTTTPAPSLMETFFPWTGTAYNSVRTPEEDAAILNSISGDPTASAFPSSTDNDGIMSWLSIPGFGSSSTSGATNAISSSQPMMSPPNYPPPGPMNYNAYPMFGAASQNQPIVVPPPGAENYLGMQVAPPATAIVQPSPEYPPMQSSYPPPSQYPASPQSYNPPDVNPTFQFHQQVKDSIPIPSPSLPGFGQPAFPYPYSPGGNLDFMKSTTEPSFIDMISNYFTFGKRNDLEKNLKSENESVVMQARSMNGEDVEMEEDSDVDGNDVEEKETPESDSSSKPSAPSPPASDGKAFLCPKSGIWRWNGEICIAVGPVPVWACKPNDLVVSGKIAICRNKIYFSPKVINNNQRVS